MLVIKYKSCSFYKTLNFQLVCTTKKYYDQKRTKNRKNRGYKEEGKR